MEVTAGLSKVQDLELSEDQNNDCSTGIGAKGGIKCLLLLLLYFPARLRAAHVQLSMVSTDIAEGYS